MSEKRWQVCAFCGKAAVNLQLHEDQYWHSLCWNMVIRGEAYR